MKKSKIPDFAQATRFSKMSKLNIVVKKLYPHLYLEVKKTNIPPRQEKKSAIKARNEFNMKRLENRQEFTYKEILDAIKKFKDSSNYYQLVFVSLLSTGRRATE